MREIPLKYVAVFRANMAPPSQDIPAVNQTDFRVSFSPGPIDFSYSQPVITYTPPAATATMAELRLQFPPDSYCLIEINTRGYDPRGMVNQATLRVAETVALIDLRFPGLLPEKLFEGVVNVPGSMMWIAEGPLTLTAQPSLAIDSITQEVEHLLFTLSSVPVNRRERFRLAARWFRRARETMNPIDRFLALWIVLEIHPGEGATNIVRNLCEFVGDYFSTNQSWTEVKSKLRVGHIYGERKRIFHEGRALVDSSERQAFEDLLARLLALAETSLCALAGLPHGRELERYLE